MTTNTGQPDQMTLWTRHTLTGVIGTWRGSRVPRGLGVNAGAAATYGQAVSSQVADSKAKAVTTRAPATRSHDHPKASSARRTTTKTVPASGSLGVARSRTRGPKTAAKLSLHKAPSATTNNGTPAAATDHQTEDQGPTARPSTGRRTSSRIKTQQDTTSKKQQVKPLVVVKVPKVTRSRQEKRYICTDQAKDARFDCGHNDYYHTNPPAGSYLATYWNMADSLWLVANGSTDPTPTPGPCSNYATKHTGTLNQGASAIQPNGTWYQSTTSGTHAGCVDGPDGTDFDLHLQKWNGSGWTTVAKAETEQADETLSYSGTAGYYQYKVVAYAGSGGYTFGMNKP